MVFKYCVFRIGVWKPWVKGKCWKYKRCMVRRMPPILNIDRILPRVTCAADDLMANYVVGADDELCWAWIMFIESPCIVYRSCCIVYTDGHWSRPHRSFPAVTPRTTVCKHRTRDRSSSMLTLILSEGLSQDSICHTVLWRKAIESAFRKCWYKNWGTLLETVRSFPNIRHLSGPTQPLSGRGE